jgi:hypothetical protein
MLFMDKKQKIAIILSPFLTLVMFGVYQDFAKIFGNNLGWHAGFAVYWPIFCVLIPLLLVGSNQICKKYRLIKINPLYLQYFFFQCLWLCLVGFL